MTFKSHIFRFLGEHIFSWRILHCNFFNMIFWIFVFAGGSFGFGRGFIPCLVGLVLGALAGTCFLGLGYIQYHRSHTSQLNQNNDKKDA